MKNIKINKNSNKGLFCGNAVLHSLHITDSADQSYYSCELVKIIKDYGYSVKQTHSNLHPSYQKSGTLKSFIDEHKTGVWLLFVRKHFILWNAEKNEITDTANCGGRTVVIEAHKVVA